MTFFLKNINLQIFKFNSIFSDAPVSWQLGFQNPATPIMESLITLYNYIFIFIILIFVVVIWFLVRSLYLFHESKNPESFEFNHDPVIETVWTIAPAFILIAIAIPSFSLLYAMDEVVSPALTVKAIGHQWYWSYEVNVSRIDYLFDYIQARTPMIKGKSGTKAIYSFQQLNEFGKKFSNMVEGPSLLRRSLLYKTLRHTIAFKPYPYIFNFSTAVERACQDISKPFPYEFFKPEFNLFFDKEPGKSFKKFYEVRTGLFHLLAFIGFDRQNRHSFTFISPTLKFNSYMVPEADLPFGGLRLLEVDNRLVLPVGLHIRLLVTSTDVIHSWAVPSLGIKIDAIPGRLNQTGIFINRSGIFYGQCSELCGVNHAFMPIVIEAVPLDKFIKLSRIALQPKTLSEFKACDIRIS